MNTTTLASARHAHRCRRIVVALKRHLSGGFYDYDAALAAAVKELMSPRATLTARTLARSDSAAREAVDVLASQGYDYDADADDGFSLARLDALLDGPDEIAASAAAAADDAAYYAEHSSY